jgi:hypothetical protein
MGECGLGGELRVGQQQLKVGVCAALLLPFGCRQLQAFQARKVPPLLLQQLQIASLRGTLPLPSQLCFRCRV